MRRPSRSKIVSRLIDPIRTKVRRPIARIQRSFPRTPPRWSLKRRVFNRPWPGKQSSRGDR